MPGLTTADVDLRVAEVTCTSKADAGAINLARCFPFRLPHARKQKIDAVKDAHRDEEGETRGSQTSIS